VLIEASDVVPGCPSCGVVSTRVHQRSRQRLRDVPVAGPVTVVWLKRRWRCAEALCARATFTEHTAQVPPYARSTARLRAELVDAVRHSRRAVDEVARSFRVGWWTVQRELSRAAAVLAGPEHRLVARLGIDEHRFRRVRFFRDETTGGWRRVEPWMVSFVDLDTGAVLGLVDGRDSAAVRGWLLARPRWWRHRVRVVAIDPSAAFRKAVKPLLPNADVAVDHWHLVKLGNDAVTRVRQRVAQQHKGRRGRATDLA
jgi:transposase